MKFVSIWDYEKNNEEESGSGRGLIRNKKMKITYNVVVVGAGGTGSFFIKEFARYMAYDVQLEYERKIRMCVVDGDMLEAKNLDRQAFCEEDIGEYKAVALVEAVKSNFENIKITAMPKYITEAGELRDIFGAFSDWFDQGEYSYYHSGNLKVNVLIGACDNNRCRQVMHEWFLDMGDCIYIDSGNGFSNGQVVVGIREKRETIAPDACMCFPDMLSDTSPDAVHKSCSEINVSEPQHIVTNMLAGNIMLAHICNLMAGSIEPGITFFDAFHLFVRFTPASELDIEDMEKESIKEETEQAEKEVP